jgi:hypothetical protein
MFYAVFCHLCSLYAETNPQGRAHQPEPHQKGSEKPRTHQVEGIRVVDEFVLVVDRRTGPLFQFQRYLGVQESAAVPSVEQAKAIGPGIIRLSPRSN